MSAAYTRIHLAAQDRLSDWRVRGEPLGRYFVLHKRPKVFGNSGGGLWRVTHRATGRALIRRETRNGALRAWKTVCALTRKHRLDWSFTNAADALKFPKPAVLRFRRLQWPR